MTLFFRNYNDFFSLFKDRVNDQGKGAVACYYLKDGNPIHLKEKKDFKELSYPIVVREKFDVDDTVCTSLRVLTDQEISKKYKEIKFLFEEFNSFFKIKEAIEKGN